MEQHLNTFENGMNKDFNILYQPNGTYRNMVNCQLISQDGNNFVIKDCLGNTRVFNINIPFATFVSGAPPTVTYQTEPMIIAFISFPDRLMVLSTNNDTETGGYGEIGEIKFAPYGEGIQPINNNPVNTYKGYVPLYHHKDLNFTKLRKIEGFAFEENDVIKRIYWTDNLNEPRVFDLGNPIYSTFYPDGSLSVGERYMVVEGAITHNGIVYGPGLTYDPIGGNVFTAVNANYVDESVSFVTAKVIKYYPYQLLSFTPSRALGNMRFREYGTGVLNAGTKIYFYRLLSSVDGINTSWSYGSSPIHVGTVNSIPSVPINPYENFVGAGTTTVLEITNYSVKLDIDNIDVNFDRIQIACAEYDQLLNVPRQITIVSDELITGQSMTLEHTGSANLGSLTQDDITLFPASIITCKTMSTNKNYILIGNTSEREELDFDKTGITIGQIDYRMPCHQNNNECSNVFLYNEIGPLVNSNPPLVDGIPPFTHWYVGSGIATYNGIAYGPGQVGGEVFIGVPSVFDWVNTSAAVVRPCVSKNKYTTNTAQLRPDACVIRGLPGSIQGFWNYKDPAVAHHVKGYWNYETYRFGITFFDLKGNPFYTRWIGDYTTAKQDLKFIMETYAYRAAAPTDMAYLNQTGITVSGITIPAADIDKISGFSIVRAERDKRIITQGLLMPCSSTVAPPAVPNNFFPTPGPIPSSAGGFNGGDGNYSYYSYLSPDSLVNYPMNDFNINNYIEEACWLDPKLTALGAYMKSVVNDYQTETKYLNAVVSDGRTFRRKKVTALSVVNENITTTNFGATGIGFINGLINFQAGTAFTDLTCTGGGVLNLINSISAGCRKVALRIEGYIEDYNRTVDYDDATLGGQGASDYRKLLVNFVKDNATPYGGASEAALASTNYIQCGHFQPINITVKSETFDGVNYVFNNVEIWGGDAYTCLVDLGYGLYDSASIGAFGSTQGYSWGIKYPCQSNSNYDLRRGRKIANNMMHSLPNGVAYLESGTTRLEGFSYNQGYSSDGENFSYPSLPVNFISSGKFKYRVRYAGVKFPGELVNTFRTFLINDYKDTDGQGGEINNIKTKNGRSIVWQNKIISTVPILERQLLGAGSGQDTIIGTGGVVDRFDPINDYFGNQHQWGLTETEYGFAWFDMRRKAFVVLDLNSGITEVSKIDGMKSFFDEIFIDNVGSTIQPYPLNSPTFDKTSDRPLIGVGITGVYDPKLKMTYLTFKWRVYSSLGDFPKYTTKNFTVGYYHLGKQFIGFYDMNGAIYHNHNQTVLAVNDPKNKTKFYGPGMGITFFVKGETVMVGNVEYVCINDVTVNSYPGTSGASGTNPITGTNNWTLINKTNEVYVHNQPVSLNQTPAPDYQYNKFFGLVVNNEIEFIVNPKTENSFSALNREEKGNNVKYTDVYIDADGITASDVSISATNRFFRYIYDKITASYPLSTTGRITNSYLKVKLVKKNWTTNPVTLTGATKVLQWVKTYFEQKR